VVVISAGSKVGKSTLIRELMKTDGIIVLSDNYCFVKGDRVRTIEEPFRAAPPSTFKVDFYGRSINGYPTKFEAKIDHAVFMERGSENELYGIDASEFNKAVQRINDQEAEGVFYLNKEDVLRRDGQNFNIDPNLPFYRLCMGNGIEQIPEIRKMILSLVT
jgi:hypothetical protein